MRGYDLHHHLSGFTFLGDATTSGVLVRAGRYPGLITGTGTVKGELYAMNDPAADLEALDELEEFDPTDPTASLYRRVLGDVSCGEGTVRAWMYVYNRADATSDIIAGGDWRTAERR
jgi:gamma-glutamylcyclotransferase (GGCT)/AIG2-like uncharacterized protein YtfP